METPSEVANEGRTSYGQAGHATIPMIPKLRPIDPVTVEALERELRKVQEREAQQASFLAEFDEETRRDILKALRRWN